MGVSTKNFPSVSVGYSADLSNGYSEFCRKTPTNSTPLGFRSALNFFRLGLGNFCSAALLAILHSAVSTHVHLVRLMRGPAEVIGRIVARVPIIVGNVGFSRNRSWQKCFGNKFVSQYPLDATSVFLENEGDISPWCDRARQWNRGFASCGSFIAPHTRLSSPTTNVALVGHFIERESFNLTPFGGFHG